MTQMLLMAILICGGCAVLTLLVAWVCDYQMRKVRSYGLPRPRDLD